MKKVLRWTLYLAAGTGVLLVGLILYARFVIGVNVPIGGGELNPSLLADRIRLPQGFSMGIYADGLADPRILRFTRSGDLLVANPSSGNVLVLQDNDGNGESDQQHTLIRGLNGPNGLDFFGEWLYIAESDAIGRVPFNHERGELNGEYQHLVTGLPGGGNHWKKTLRFGPDGMMYVAMGSSCNVCIEEDERRATIMRYQPDGSGEEVFARGLRNSAGFDWSPVDRKLYATDNGRDLLGDDFPPGELNQVRQGHHYGWPYANGARSLDPDFGEGNESKVAETAVPIHHFPAHNAPLGIEFVRGAAFPADYQGAAIVALHGSWNRTAKDGYKVVSLHWAEDGQITERDFVSGFLTDDEVIGRPAEVAEGPDGAFYIADDYAGAIYRVAYAEPQTLRSPRTMTTTTFDAIETLSTYSAVERTTLSQRGERLFHEHACMECHNNRDAGLQPLENIGSKYDLDAISDFLETPTPPMPVFPLQPADREALAVHLIGSY